MSPSQPQDFASRSAAAMPRPVMPSAAHAEPPLGFAEFSRAVSESFVPLRVTAPSQGGFRGAVSVAVCDGVHASLVEAGQHTVERTPELIARDDTAYFKLSVQLSGTGMLVQDGREALLEPGDIAIYSTERPYVLEFNQDFRTLVLMFDHHTLGIAPDTLAQLTAVRMPHDSALTSVISPFLSGLASNLGVLNGPAGTRLSRAAVDLTTTLYSTELGAAASASPKAALTSTIMQYIDDHLGSSALDPQSIAAANHVSLRYLHALFSEQGTTVSTWVRERRLEYCRRDLTDPAFAALPVAAVAARWGFLDAAHFSRAFKTSFGLPPSELRRKALLDAA